MTDTADKDAIAFTLDGREVTARPDETIWQVAAREGVEIPHLCYSTATDYRADGNCRACMVEIEGERVLAASCIRKPSPGMAVKTASERATGARRMVMELLLADQPAREDAHDPNSELWHWAEAMGQLDSRFIVRLQANHRAAPAKEQGRVISSGGLVGAGLHPRRVGSHGHTSRLFDDAPQLPAVDPHHRELVVLDALGRGLTSLVGLDPLERARPGPPPGLQFTADGGPAHCRGGGR